MNYVELIGRILYATVFLVSVPGFFTDDRMITYAIASGVPFPAIAVPLAGTIALLGSVSILLGYKTKIGAWLLVVFLVPVTLMVHPFWGIADPWSAAQQKIQFMKNLSLAGAALMIAYFGAGWFSLDSRSRR